ncbi:YmjA family protein [Tatumella terrea]
MVLSSAAAAGSRRYPLLPREQIMNNDVSLKYYDIVDEYATETETAVAENERDALAHYFQLLITRLNDNEEISEQAQQEMAREAGIAAERIDDVADFLNRWGNE